VSGVTVWTDSAAAGGPVTSLRFGGKISDGIMATISIKPIAKIKRRSICYFLGYWITAALPEGWHRSIRRAPIQDPFKAP
jgi:hypothetical protein